MRAATTPTRLMSHSDPRDDAGQGAVRGERRPSRVLIRFREDVRSQVPITNTRENEHA